MSCFVVPDYHVSALVAWGLRHGAIVGISPDALAHELAAANRAAYSERYAGRYDSELAPYGGLDHHAGAELSPVAVVKACDCLAYQASDWSAWSGSEPSAHLAVIRAAALRLVPEGRTLAPDAAAHALPGYEAAAWCLDEPELVADACAVVAALRELAIHPSHYARLVAALNRAGVAV
jgi:hypothetical protein